MFVIPPLTPALLEQLGEEIGGCSFIDDNQKTFLSANTSCDVQAAPGNGKTTLLVAKLALLSRSWVSRTKGVCVISHTNVAREEVEKRLYTHPSASAFLSYPHFIGTVTAFIDRFIALPYLRGLGWSVQRIDDEVAAAVALSRFSSKPTLLATSWRNGNGVRDWVSGMELDESFVCDVDITPTRLKIRNKGNRQPRENTKSGIELEQLKAEIVSNGFYRFGDMMTIAYQAIDKCPSLIDRIRRRFPLVLLDEAQDTNGKLLALLNRLFGDDGVAFQKLGDQNQTLYENEDLMPDDYWVAGEDVIPLNETKRFGNGIAVFASRLTVRAQQQILGSPGIQSRRILILFDRPSILQVLSIYAGEVRAHWGNNLTPEHEIWAVASRHNPTSDRTGEWPKTLIDYCPDYRSGKGRSSRPDTLCVSMRQASIMRENKSSPMEIMDLITSGVIELLRRQGVQDQAGQPIGKRNLWNYLASRDPQLPLKLRRMMRDRVVFGNAAWDASTWDLFCHDLKALLLMNQHLTPAATAYFEFVAEGAVDSNGQARQRLRTTFIHDDIPIKLGSIHSVKGKTVDSILVVETEIWRGQALNRRAMDLATTLPHAFGLEDRNFSTNPAQLAAATNIFVAATRPRELLACAVRKEVVGNPLITAARDQGWQVLDIT